MNNYTMIDEDGYQIKSVTGTLSQARMVQLLIAANWGGEAIFNEDGTLNMDYVERKVRIIQVAPIGFDEAVADLKDRGDQHLLSRLEETLEWMVALDGKCAVQKRSGQLGGVYLNNF